MDQVTGELGRMLPGHRTLMVFHLAFCLTAFGDNLARLACHRQKSARTNSIEIKRILS